MTPEILAAELRQRLPNTEITLGDKPGRVIVRMATGAHPLTIYIALSKSGDQAEIGDDDPVQRPRDRGREPISTTMVMDRIAQIITDYTTHSPYRFGRDPYVEPRIRAWAHLPDMPPSVKDRARALLDSDRNTATKLCEDFRLCKENIAALELALGMTPQSDSGIAAG